MRRLGALLLPLVVSLAAGIAAATAAPGAPTRIRFGVAEDATKYAEDGGNALFQTMRDLGMVENRVTVFWDESTPTTILEQDFLDRMIPVAQQNGIRVVFAVQPLHARAFATDAQTRIEAYSVFLRSLALRYPSVRDFVIGNEPNQRRFLQPQHAADGTIVSARTYEKLAAASYDALKRVDPSIDVVGLATAPGGNDQPLGAGNESVSPVRFVVALGAAYRASGRKLPLMDDVDIHVYSAKNPIPLTTHRKWPQVGPADLDRVKQAWWDAFHDTGQPLFQESTAKPPPAGTRFVTFRLDETGTQVRLQNVDPKLYTGKENIPLVAEATQAQWYGDLIRLVSCDETVSSLLFFHLIDEPSLLGFQSGLLRVDGSRRPAYAAVRAAIAAAGTCASPHTWRHSVSVAGARAEFELAPKPAAQRKFWLTVRTGEEATVVAGIFRVSGDAPPPRPVLGEALSRPPPGAVLSQPAFLLKANSGRRVELRGRLRRGSYVFAVLLRSTMNPARTKVLRSAPFDVT